MIGNLSNRKFSQMVTIVLIGGLGFWAYRRADHVIVTYHQQYLIHQGTGIVEQTFRDKEDKFERDWDSFGSGGLGPQGTSPESRSLGIASNGSQRHLALNDAPAAGDSRPTASAQKEAPVDQSVQADPAQVAKDYARDSHFKPTADMPNPALAEASTIGQYQGLLNLFFGKFPLARVLLVAVLLGAGWIGYRKLSRAIEEELVRRQVNQSGL
ncbi:hypothetical protein [Oryzomonas rubra]|uniref:Uncharacterized protein n=1 Tax=Oryzomonas rubra TaxID=2509454 RepID=A0A5A9X6K5_9BACT|nr:hypothetical protein [Oryzomonas rubra]KAA0888078.1 hypothetical protein ET418_16900 [Oryzomonas rubra]